MRNLLLLGGTALALVACQGVEQGVPLVFGRTQTVGISVAGSVPDQGAHLTVGFSDRNIAVVPTTQSNGNPIRSRAAGNFEDSLSVLGQFEANAQGSAGVTAGLGTFFSTGIAARNLAEGFRDKLRGFRPAVEADRVIPKADGNSSGGGE